MYSITATTDRNPPDAEAVGEGLWSQFTMARVNDSRFTGSHASTAGLQPGPLPKGPIIGRRVEGPQIASCPVRARRDASRKAPSIQKASSQLLTTKLLKWSGRESNPRPLHCEKILAEPQKA